jgi:hypothetical protein
VVERARVGSRRGKDPSFGHRGRGSSGNEPSPSTDDRIASDTSERQGDHGEWSVGNTGFRDGFFYAKVGRSPGCRGDLSKTIELVDGVPQ